MEYKTNIKVRYNETDQMGVVYHANYFAWFDIGRTGYLGELGLDYSGLEEAGIFLPVIDANCKYIKPAKYGDEIIITSKLRKLKGIRLEFNYQIFRKEDNEEDNILLAEGTTNHAFVDENLKPMNLKKKYREVWDILKENC